jgi:hypothetical protein
MDFISGLPSSGRYNYILVIVDKFTRYAHIIPLHRHFSVATVAQSFLDHIYKLHSMLSIIISDRDPIFTSIFWTKLWALVVTYLNLSTANHPWTDEQTERVNLCFEIYLRCFVHSTPTKWSQWLSLGEHCYNTIPHSTLGHSPFKILYHYQPQIWGVIH